MDTISDSSKKNGVPERFFPKVDQEWYRRRLSKMIVWMFVVFCILMVQLFNLQILQGDHYRSLSENNCIRKQRIQPLRGHIYDRNGLLLVDNRPAFDLYIVPADASPVNETAKNLSRFISRSSDEIGELISRHRGPYGYRPVLVKTDISRDLMGQLMTRRYELPGIVIQTSPRRNYTRERFAPHLIGYIGEISSGELTSNRYPHKRGGDMVGRVGVERTFEESLSGYHGTRVVQVTATGQVVSVLGEDPAVPGHNVHLTVDFDLQLTAQRLLDGKTGAIVAIDPSNGDILAMASSPSYDQRLFSDRISTRQWQKLLTDPDRPLQNRVLQSTYPPASTYKIITAMAALEEDVFDDKDTVFCTGRYRLGDRTFRCWRREGHGHQNIVDAMSESCDVFFYEAGKQLGVDRIASYARQSWLGKRTGIDLGNEATGLIPTASWKRDRFGEPWFAGETLPVAIGQGYNLTTPLQMGMLTAAIANGGSIYKPQIMRFIQNVGGNIEKNTSPEMLGRLPASDETLEIIRKGLYNVVNDRKGTAYWFVRSDEVDISGKTGTAQVISRLTEEIDLMTTDEISEETRRRLLPHAWFVGYAPSDDPEIAVSVIIEHGRGGASTAGPIAREMMESYIRGYSPGNLMEPLPGTGQ